MKLSLILLAVAMTVPTTSVPNPRNATHSAGGAGKAVSACCYVNDTYAGVCRVVLTQTETCPGILAYLNTPNTAGKTYCDSTRIRGGWRSVPCPPSPTPTPAAGGGRVSS